MASKPPKARSAWQEGKTPASVEEYCLCLDASRVMSAEDCRAFVASLPEEKRPQTAKALALELLKTGKLTRYQAQGVLQGKIRFLTFGEYFILEKLGEGGMGQVFKAEHRRMRRTVALKVLSGAAMKDADARKRFEREVHAAARLIHPNIVTAFDANEHEGVHFLVMEFVDGHDLSVILGKQGPLPPATAIDYVLQAARALSFAHSKGVVHRDIKPGNLLVDRDGTVKILDMGLARIDLGGGGQELTNTGQVMGTVDYMAPEQAEDTHSADARADIYSLGCTLYRLLSGEVLYGGDSVVKKILAHRGADIPPLRTVCPAAPAALEATYRKMVAKKAADRQQTMADVVAELEGVAREMVRSPGAPAQGDERTVDLKFSEFLSGLSEKTSKSATVTAQKSTTLVSAANEVTQDLTSERTTAGMRSAATTTLVQPLVPAASTAKPSATKPSRGEVVKRAKKMWIAAGAAVLGLALAAAGVVMFLPAGDGTVRIEINDPSIEVTVSESGYKVKGKTEEVHIKPGEHTLHVKTGELEFDTQKFVIGKGENPALKVELLPEKVQVVKADGEKLGEQQRRKAVAAAGIAQQPATAQPAGSTAGSSAELFNGRNLDGWLQKGHSGWSVKDGVLTGTTSGPVGWLMSNREYGDFDLEFEYRLPPGGNSGVFVRAPEEGNVTGGQFNEIQLLDDPSPKFKSVDPKGRNGALYGQVAPTKALIKTANTWRQMKIGVIGNKVRVALDGEEILDAPLRAGTASRGHIGFQLYDPGASFRNIRVRERIADGSGANGTASTTSSSRSAAASLPSNTRASESGLDLLTLVDLKRDAGVGNWRQVAGGIAGDNPAGASVLQLPYEPPDEYDLEVEFTPTAPGMNVNHYLAAQGATFAWKLNAHGRTPPLYGLELLDGKLMPQRSEGTTPFDVALQVGQRYRSTVEVRKGTIKGLLDGREIMQWTGDFKRLSMERVTPMPFPGRLGIGSWRRAVTFHKVTVREISSPGKLHATVAR